MRQLERQGRVKRHLCDQQHVLNYDVVGLRKTRIPYGPGEQGREPNNRLRSLIL